MVPFLPCKTRVGMLHTVARNTSICAMTVKPQWEEQGQAASPSNALRSAMTREREMSKSYVQPALSF